MGSGAIIIPPNVLCQSHDILFFFRRAKGEGHRIAHIYSGRIALSLQLVAESIAECLLTICARLSSHPGPEWREKSKMARKRKTFRPPKSDVSMLTPLENRTKPNRRTRSRLTPEIRVPRSHISRIPPTDFLLVWKTFCGLAGAKLCK